jgi:lipopolysaccharide transport system ATP-binding protein
MPTSMPSSAQALALRCVNIEKTYSIQRTLNVWGMLFGIEKKSNKESIYALRDISLEVPRGKIVGILGKNGAGKSTLLRLLGGVYMPTKGRVDVYGNVVGLFELGGVGNPNLTGKEYAARYLRIMGTKSAELPPLLDDIKNFSELGDAFEQRVRTYSSGMGARLYFATATVLQHEIYLIDELLSVGDEHFQAKCWRRMRQRLLGGASGVLVTHDWTAILKLCETTHVIESGRFSYSGSSDKAVVSYLKIAKPEATAAQFASCNDETHVVQCGSDSTIRLWVDITETGPVDLAISVEMLRVGIGWEIVLLADNMALPGDVGRYAVDMLIPHVPLVAGQYSLNVFLSKRGTFGHPAVPLDRRSWTLGNGMTLLVEGSPVSTAVKLPFLARKLSKVS